MRKVYFFGSSHCKRLFLATKHIISNQIFSLIDLTKPGKRFCELKLPKFQFSSNDILIIQVFGNDLFKRYIKIERKGSEKIIHLLKVVPNSEDYILSDYESLAYFLKSCPAKIILIDNPWRHLRCCTEHQDKKCLWFQRTQNKKFKEYFESMQLKNLCVIDHKSLINLKRFQKQNACLYATFQPDSVHFRDQIYQDMIRKLFDIYIK